MIYEDFLDINTVILLTSDNLQKMWSDSAIYIKNLRTL